MPIECSVFGGIKGACCVMSFQNCVKPLMGNATGNNSSKFATKHKGIMTTHSLMLQDRLKTTWKTAAGKFCLTALLF